MSVVQVFPSFVMLSLAYVFVSDGLPSVKMWFDHGEDWCCDLSKVKMMEMIGFCQVMWFLTLESAKERILGVDTMGQHVPPRVRYGMACLLIRYAIGCVSCSVELWWLLFVWPVPVTFCVNYLNHMVQKGHCVRKTSALQAGPLCAGNHSKAWHTFVVDLCNGM
jgi:hypothetical protein